VPLPIGIIITMVIDRRHAVVIPLN